MLTPQCGAQNLGIEPLLVLPDLGRVRTDVVARGCHVNVHVALSPGGATRAASAEPEGQEAALLLLEGKELTAVHMAAAAEARVHTVGIVRVGWGLEGGVLGGGEERLGWGGAHGGRGGCPWTVARLAVMELKR